MSPRSSQSTQEIGLRATWAYSVVCLLFLVIAFSFSSFAFAETPKVAKPEHIKLSGSLPPATAAKPYNSVLAVSGGRSPYRLGISVGHLPKGLSLNTTTGSITGTPLATGTYPFTVAVSDHVGNHSQQAMSLLVNAEHRGDVDVSVSPATGSVQSAGTQQFSAAVTGTTQTGVTWSASAGSVNSSGLFTAPTVSTATNVTVTATSTFRATSKASATVAVMPKNGGGITVSISPSSSSLQSAGTQQFSATVTGTNQTGVTWSASAGTIAANGLFTAPTISSATNVTVTATSTASASSKASAIVAVTPKSGPPPALTITTTAIPSATAGSAYVAGLSAAGGTQPYQWTLTGSLPSGIQFTASNATLAGTTSQHGQFSLTAKVTDTNGNSATQGFTLVVSTQAAGAYDGPAELPRAYMQSTLANTPAPGSTIFVPAGNSLQAALNIANCGDTISLAAGATFTGPFFFPAKPCDPQHWIIVRTGAPDSALPPEGVRITPCFAGVPSLPGRPPFNCNSTQNVMARLVMPVTGDGPVVFSSGAHYYRLLGLEVTRPANGTIVFALAGPANNATADHIVLDRLWIHGTAQDETTHGVRLGGSQYFAVVDSFITDLHCVSITGTCTDAQAISGGVGNTPMGPYKIVNNFLEASAENILFGGAAATLAPADIEIRRNHLFKPLIWMKGQPGYIGGTNGNPFSVKNLFELKNGQRVLFEANILENTWGGFSQSGFGVLLTPKNQTNGVTNICPLCQVTDITIRYTTISHVAAGFQISNSVSGTGGAPLDGERYSIHDVTVDDINGPKYAGNGVFATLSMLGSNLPVLRNVQINHVTAFAANTMLGVGSMTSQMSNISFTNSIVTAGNFPVWSTGGVTNCAYPNKPLLVFNACFKPYVFASNVIIATPLNSPPTTWPSGTLFTSTPASVGFVNYNNGNGGDYRLLPSSPYHNAASDGKDIGADVAAISSAIAGVY